MRRFGLVRNLVCGAGLLLTLSFAALDARATPRGFAVPIRSADAPKSGVIDSVQLYEDSHALVIGIDRYRAGWPVLRNAVKDAKLVAESLKKRGFDVTLKLNTDSETLEKVLKEFFVIKGQKPESRLFVWFAGHGHTENGEGYLVPADAPPPEKSVSQFRLKAVSLRRFGDFVRLAESKHAFAVFDSCFAGTVFDSARALPPAAITRATTLPVRQFLTSGDAGQTVSDDGVFRQLFLRALDGEENADSNNDGFVTGTEIGLHMTNRITNLTRSKQTPRYGKLRDRDWDRGDYVFRLDRLETPAEDTELAIWKLVERAGDRSGYEAYLAQFPKGRFAAAARVKVSSFDRPAAADGDAELRRLEQERQALAAERARLRLETARTSAELERQRQRIASLKQPPSGPTAEAPPRRWEIAEPIPFVQLPVGTELNYGSWAYRVTGGRGHRTVIRTRGNDVKMIFGTVAVLGEGIFSIHPNPAELDTVQNPRIKLEADAPRKMNAFWPLRQGGRVEFDLQEIYDNSEWSGAKFDRWIMRSHVLRGEEIRVADKAFRAVVILTLGSSERGREFEQTLWYAPDSGLILKLIRRWRGKDVRHTLKGTNPGDVQQYELIHFVFPTGGRITSN